MRAYLASSIGVACTAALALPLALHPDPAHARAERTVAAGSTQSLPLRPLVGGGLDGGVGRGVDGGVDRDVARDVDGGADRDVGREADEDVGREVDQGMGREVDEGARRGVDRGADPSVDRGVAVPGADAPAADRGVIASGVRPFSLVGVVWDRPAAELRGRAQVRTRAVGGEWTPWRELLPYGDEAPDPDSPERLAARAHGGTAPLWVGASDGVQARVRPEPASAADARAAAALPSGLRLELIDPGEAPAPPPPDRAALRALPARPVPTARGVARTGGASAGAAPTAPGARPSAGASRKPPSGSSGTSAKPRPYPATRQPSPATPPSIQPSAPPSAPPSSALPAEVTKANAARYGAPRPRIVTRAGWGADEKIRETGHVYSKTVKVAFIHHTVTGNKYSCSEAPSLLRSIYRYHVKSLGWRDYGYNFTIDKCGNIYEGRSGGVAKAVRGAHTLGFNTDSMGVAVLGTFSTQKPPAKAVTAIAKLTAWKLGLFKRNPRGTAHLVSGGGNKYKRGASVKLDVIAGHRDGFATECPGERLHEKLGSVRKTAARLQGR
ncbi:peptidoglycan recognition protein family protein [Streptomyces malaysiensis]|uniref:Peptidoglycan recognition protein n=1 Tax=Streptomyces malaysiensis subsp. samsunensis TaxID=459658 RepID=A0A9X2M032_STRMQ|nr:peptidoglycan recognition protein [Streptomyces samsunensis]MCQ8832937.1 peptidoglycan recognition protein [Streptomyces samsunensis]